MKRLLLLSAILFQFLLVQAQDSSKVPVIHVATVTNTTADNYSKSTAFEDGSYFSFNTDLLQCAYFQPNIGAEYRRNKVECGLNIGYTFPSPLFSVNTLADGQYTWPGTVYYGEALRLYVKFFANPNKPTHYWSFQVTIKNQWYNNVDFTDQPSGGDIPFYYTMDEKETVLGFELLHGHEFYAGSLLYFDLFYGLGYHVRFRQFEVVTSSSYNPYSGYLPCGYYKGTISYLLPVVGFRAGFNFRHKTAAVKAN
jgi:hypothetical protein